MTEKTNAEKKPILELIDEKGLADGKNSYLALIDEEKSRLEDKT